MRRALPALLLVPVLAAATPSPAGAGDSAPADRTLPSVLEAKRRDAIRRGCAYLVSRQAKAGSFGQDKGIVAISALSTLALLASGSGIGRGPWGPNVRDGARFLVDCSTPPGSDVKSPAGYFRYPQDPDSRMHGHGFATLALASALASADAGSPSAETIRGVLRLAVRCAEQSQTATGGWTYDPTSSQEHEGSVTVTIVQGLRAAHDAGLRVNEEVVRRGVRYLRQSQKADGSFKYSIQQDKSTYALTAAAVSSFHLLGRYAANADEDAPRIRAGIRFMKEQLGDVMRRREWFFYGHFYAGWAAWQHDGHPPTADDDRWSEDPSDDDLLRGDAFWAPWRAKVLSSLVANQRGDGSWNDPDDRFAFGDVLPTAFAVLTLAIPDEAIPVFQR